MGKVKEKKTEEVTVKLEFFYVKTDAPEEFIDKLEQLCRKYCHSKEFLFKYSVES